MTSIVFMKLDNIEARVQPAIHFHAFVERRSPYQKLPTVGKAATTAAAAATNSALANIHLIVLAQ